MELNARINRYFDRPEMADALAAAIGRLVRIPSMKGPPAPGAPYGPGPAAVLEEALALCRDMGFSARSYDGYVGLADLNDRQTRLHILGHLDVVAAGTGWTATDPFAPKLDGGMLYGRGVADDKGPVVATLFAMKAARDLDLPLKANVRMIMGLDEESGSSDIAYYYAREPYAPYTFSPDADFPLIHVEKGHYHPDFAARWAPSAALPRVAGLEGGIRANVVPPEARALVPGLDRACAQSLCASMEARTGARFTLADGAQGLEITCAGTNAHASTPEQGNNAITALLALLAEAPLADCGSTRAVRGLHALFPHGDTAGAALGIAQSDGISGALTVNLALLHLDESGFSAKIDARCPLCANEENCRHAAERAFARYGIAVTGDAEMVPPHHVDADAPLVRTLLDCYRAYTGDRDARPLAIGGATYVHNIPGGVAFGPNMPGFDCRMHAADERIRLADLLTACKIFTQAIAALCG